MVFNYWFGDPSADAWRVTPLPAQRPEGRERDDPMALGR
jgi:hypothetical protein